MISCSLLYTRFDYVDVDDDVRWHQIFWLLWHHQWWWLSAGVADDVTTDSCVPFFSNKIISTVYAQVCIAPVNVLSNTEYMYVRVRVYEGENICVWQWEYNVCERARMNFVLYSPSYLWHCSWLHACLVWGTDPFPNNPLTSEAGICVWTSLPLSDANNSAFYIPPIHIGLCKEIISVWTFLSRSFCHFTCEHLSVPGYMNPQHCLSWIPYTHFFSSGLK